jgi:hypothetical protein
LTVCAATCTAMQASASSGQDSSFPAWSHARQRKPALSEAEGWQVWPLFLIALVLMAWPSLAASWPNPKHKPEPSTA